LAEPDTAADPADTAAGHRRPRWKAPVLVIVVLAISMAAAHQRR
jgi:hypothetical protein